MIPRHIKRRPLGQANCGVLHLCSDGNSLGGVVPLNSTYLLCRTKQFCINIYLLLSRFSCLNIDCIFNSPSPSLSLSLFRFPLSLSHCSLLKNSVTGSANHFAYLLEGQPEGERPRRHTYPAWQEALVQSYESLLAHRLTQAVQRSAIEQATAIECYIVA